MLISRFQKKNPQCHPVLWSWLSRNSNLVLIVIVTVQIDDNYQLPGITPSISVSADVSYTWHHHHLLGRVHQCHQCPMSVFPCIGIRTCQFVVPQLYDVSTKFCRFCFKFPLSLQSHCLRLVIRDTIEYFLGPFKLSNGHHLRQDVERYYLRVGVDSKIPKDQRALAALVSKHATKGRQRSPATQREVKMTW